MTTGVERGVSFFANLISIITFAAAVLGWAGAYQVPNYAPANWGVSLLLTLVFAAFSGYGTSMLLKDRYEKGQGFFFLMLLFVIIYCFSFAYLRNYLIVGLPQAQRASFASAAFLGGFLLYFLLNAILFCYGIWFKGGNIVWKFITAVFRPSYWAGFATMLIHLVGVPMLLIAFDAGPIGPIGNLPLPVTQRN